MTVRLLIGDARERIAEIPDGSIDFAMSSPPFLSLRTYLPDDHPDKAREIGSERTPADFLDALLGLTAQLGEKLTPYGSLCFELGDVYSGSGGAGGDYNNGLRAGQPKPRSGSAARNRAAFTGALEHPEATKPGTRSRLAAGSGWPLPKSLCGIPFLYAFSLAYGFNLLTGAESPAGQWRVRNVVAWCRPNPMPRDDGDKFRPATSYLTIACRSKTRWFDLTAVRNPERAPTAAKGEPKAAAKVEAGITSGNLMSKRTFHAHGGAPPLDWWQINVRGFNGAHYAVYPPELCERPIKSMCPERVCTECGEPQRRIVGKGEQRGKTLGWTYCEHEAWRPGVVLDPFAGTGTTLQVAAENGRDSIGIDIDERNAELTRQRLGKAGIAVDIDYGANLAGAA